MFYRQTKPQELLERLNAEYYSPENVANQDKISRIGYEALSSFYSSTGIGHTASIEPHYASTGEPAAVFVSGKGIKQGDLNIDSCARVKLSSHTDELKKSQLNAGDLLVVRKGDTGNSCVVPQSITDSNCSSEVIFFKGVSEINAYFISVYLNSYHGRTAFKRLQRGSLIPGVSLLDVPSFEVLKLDTFAKKYIGEKVRQAERLRAWAKSIKQSLQVLENDIPVKKYPRTNKKFAISKTFDLTENRLDAEFYEDKHIDLSRQFNGEFFSLGALTTGFKYGSSVKADYVAKGKGIPFVRGNALTDNEISSSDIVYLDRSLTDELKSNFLNIGDVMITRSGTVGVACDVYEGFDKYAYGSFIINAKPKPEVINSLYLSWYLNSWVGQQQFRRWENGAVQLNINTEELASIEVWAAPNEFQLKIADQIKLLRSVNTLAQCLTASAKLLVEDLIEGQLTESQLVFAQQALDAGDDSLDRALLERMTAEGIDADSEPLFDDIDQLYDLIDQAKQALDADDSMAEA
ncbi:hypothetical protein [Vibrio diazotrophicus]|uniref:hypothetical protein n=1 Tax=Vibrio diazotrophicus TaxID=685 RepID=UPI00142E70E9|nr:hypothetical protein [Vibrio diazotrophicus]NIY94383.1 hypothetical protein [Vibrio diazotrophicus]